MASWVTTLSIRCYVIFVVYSTTLWCSALTKSTLSRISICFITENTVAGEAVENVVDNINQRSSLLPDTILDVKERRLVDTDPFNAMHTACQYVNDGAVVILSSTSCPTAIALQTLANAVHIPHVMVPTSSCRMLTDSQFTISMQPEEANMETVLVSIVKSQGWRKIAVLYDTQNDRRAQRIKDRLEGWNVFQYRILIEETNTQDSQYIHGQLLDLMSTTTTFHFIVVADSETCGMVMKESHNLGMTKKKYTWVIANETFDTSDMADLAGSRASVMIVRQAPGNLNFTSDLVTNKPDSISDKYVSDIYDAVSTIAHAMDISLDSIDWENATNIDCSHQQTIWNDGSQFMEVLKMGNFSLYGRHYKQNLQIQILMYDSIAMDWTETGTWDVKNELQLTRPTLVAAYDETQRNRKLTVVTVVEPPFVEMKIQPTSVHFTGFCMDLLDKLAGLLNIEFEVYNESEYGKLVDGQWTGAVGAVAYKRADMAVSGMIVTSSREQVVDFSHSYKDYKVAILIRRNTPVGILSFRFLEPLEMKVWLYIGMCTAVVGFTLFLITRFSPYAKVTHAGDTRSDYEKFTLLNSIWFTVSSIMQQGGDMHPRSLSGRIMGAFWWFFTLIIIATYTANLAAFLTVNRMETPISSLDELVSQSKIKYGTVRNSTIQEDLLNMSQHNPTYEKISLYFKENPEFLVETDEEGYQRVKAEKYAFLWDDAVLQYKASLDCDLSIVSNQFLRKAYAIALQKNSPFRQEVSQGLLQLQDDGMLDRLWSKWFTINKRCFDKSEAIHSDDDAKGIEIKTMAGVFYVLIFGTVLAFFAAIAEIFWNRRLLHKNPELYPDTTYLSHPRWVALPPRFTGDVVAKKDKLRRSSTSISLSTTSINKISLSNHSVNRIPMPKYPAPGSPRYPQIPILYRQNSTCVAHLDDFTGHQEATV